MVRPAQDLAQERSRASVLRIVGLHGPIARTTLAKTLGVSPATITVLTRELLELGLIQTVGKRPSQGGRPAELLELVSDSAFLLGAKVTADRVIAITTDLSGDVIGSFDEPFDGRADRPLDQLEDILRHHTADGPGNLLGIGLGVPGMVDPFDGGRVFAPTLGWDNLPVGTELGRRLGLPVIVENDVHTLAVAERLYGPGSEVDDFITVTVGRGVGLGVVIGGELHSGARGGAGELGHVPAVAGGPVCECGRRGCLEAVVAEPALVQRAVDEGLLDVGASIEDLRALASNGDIGAVRVFSEAGFLLGRAVASVVNLLAPQMVLISGEGVASWPHLERSFTVSFHEAILAIHTDIDVAVDHWEDLDWARGAVSLLARSIFAPASTDGTVERLVRSRLAESASAQKLRSVDGR